MTITWRSMNIPNLAEASAPLARAQQSLLTGFDAFNDVVKQRQAMEDANFQATQENAKNAYLDALGEAKTPEELAAKQSFLAQMRNSLNPAVRAAVRGADETRLAALQRQTLANNEYTDKATEREQRPIVSNIMTNVYSGTQEGIDAATELLKQNPNLMNSPEIQKTITDYKRKLVTQGREDTRWEWDQTSQKWKAADQAQKEALFPLEVDAKKASIAASQAQAAALGEQAAAARAARTAAETDAANAVKRQQLSAALEGNLYKEGVFKDADMPELTKLMVDNGVGGKGSDAGDKRSHIVERINKLAKDGVPITVTKQDGTKDVVNVPLPVGAVKAAILSSRDKWHTWNQGWADTFEDVLRNRLQATISKKNAAGQPVAANQAVDDYEAYQAILRGQAETAPPAAKTKRR